MSRARDFAKLASSHSSGATLGHRNLLTNGDLMIDQKSETATQTGSGGKRPVDGWRQGQSNVGQLSVETSRVADAPSNTGFKYSIKTQAKTPETSLGASEDWTLLTKIEGHDCQRLMYGTSDAKTTTLSFWVKSSIAGTFAVGIYQEDGNDNISKPYTISSANTWEYKTITYTGNTLASITDDATCGLQIQWYISIGSNSTGGSNGDVWHHYTANKFAFGHVTNTHITTDESTFQLTGCQFEIGDIATPFEFKSYEKNLEKAQRYYFRTTGQGSYPFINEHPTNKSGYTGKVSFPVPMRATPAMSFTDCKLLQPQVDTSAYEVDGTFYLTTEGFHGVTWSSSSTIGSTGDANKGFYHDDSDEFWEADAWL